MGLVLVTVGVNVRIRKVKGSRLFNTVMTQ
jgi:hypothetical protein